MSDTKENILITALQLFAKDGYEAVSVSMIAGKLGMTKSALYKHYKNKRDIFDSILKRMSKMDYERAKEDFVKRTGLLPENQIFSADERFELYRCVEDALSAGFELSSDVENILADVKEKLKDSIPDFDKRLTTIDEQDQQQEQKM